MENLDIFNFEQTIVNPFLEKDKYPWEWLNEIDEYIIKLGENLGDTYERYPNNIWVSKTASVSKTAEIEGPMYYWSKKRC